MHADPTPRPAVETGETPPPLASPWRTEALHAPLELARRGLGLAALAQDAALDRLGPVRRRAAWALFALAVRLEPEIADRS